MANINFQYRSKKPIANIEVRFTFKDNDKYKSYYTSTNIEVSKEFWNGYKKNTKFSKVEKVNLKTEVDNQFTKLDKFIANRYKLEPSGIDKDWLKNVLHDFYNPKSEISIPENLLQFFDFYLLKKKREIKAGTFRKWGVVRNKLANFENDTKRTFKIKDVNKSFLDKFIIWSQEMQYDNSVINGNFKDIRSVCKEAQLYDIEVSKDLFLIKSKLKSEPAFKIYLSADELDKIIDLKNLPEHLDNVRDWLIISCYTGQRISDFKRFTPELIRTAADRIFIDIKQQKTDKDVSIPLVPIVKEILNKRNGKFPKTISDQKYNDHIKEVCRIAKINEPIEGKIATVTEIGTRKEAGIYKKWQLITSHVGRRSFATNFYGKLPTSYIKDITGHSTEAMLLKYIGKTSKDTAVEAYDLMINLKFH